MNQPLLHVRLDLFEEILGMVDLKVCSSGQRHFLLADPVTTRGSRTRKTVLSLWYLEVVRCGYGSTVAVADACPLHSDALHTVPPRKGWIVRLAVGLRNFDFFAVTVVVCIFWPYLKFSCESV